MRKKVLSLILLFIPAVLFATREYHPPIKTAEFTLKNDVKIIMEVNHDPESTDDYRKLIRLDIISTNGITYSVLQQQLDDIQYPQPSTIDYGQSLSHIEEPYFYVDFDALLTDTFSLNVQFGFDDGVLSERTLDIRGNDGSYVISGTHLSEWFEMYDVVESFEILSTNDQGRIGSAAIHLGIQKNTNAVPLLIERIQTFDADSSLYFVLSQALERIIDDSYIAGTDRMIYPEKTKEEWLTWWEENKQKFENVVIPKR